jgi:hypothetical protein
MSAPGLTLKDAFQQLRFHFEQGSHHDFDLRHFSLQAVHYVDGLVLEQVAQMYGQSLIETTRWPYTDGRVDYSCFLGKQAQFERFKRLAEQAQKLLVRSLQQAGFPPRDTVLEPHIAWIDHLYFAADCAPGPLLSVEHFRVAEWPTANDSVKVFRIAHAEADAFIESLKVEHGDPLAVHKCQALTQDVFSASTAMIDAIIADAANTPEVQQALSTPAPPSPPGKPAGRGSAAPVAEAAQALGGGAAPKFLPGQSRPDWVNQAELIGPCGHEAFAKLMDISGKQLYRLVHKGDVWKERGPSKKRFYFHHRDLDNHRRLREEFESRRVKKA